MKTSNPRYKSWIAKPSCSVVSIVIMAMACVMSPLVAQDDDVSELNEKLGSLKNELLQNESLKGKLQTVFDQWDTLLKNRQYDGLLMEMQKYSSAGDVSGVKAILENVISKESEKEAADLESKYESVIKDVTQTLNTSTEAKELDATLILLNETREGLAVRRRTAYSNNEGARNLIGLQSSIDNRISNAVAVVTLWQDYLAQKNAGNAGSAKSTLGSLASRLSGFPIISRAKILELQQGVADGGGNTVISDPFLVAKDDFINGADPSSVLERLLASSIPTKNSSNEYAFRSLLQQLVDHQKGKVLMSVHELGKQYKRIDRLAGLETMRLCELFSMELSKSLKAIYGTGAEIHSSTPLGTLEECVQFSVRKEQWDKALNAIIYLDSLGIIPEIQRLRDLKNAIESVKLGDDYVAAGMWKEAIVSYRRGLKKPVLEIPSSVFIKRITKLKDEDAERFEAMSLLADDSNAVDDYSRMAGMIWRLNQYVLSNRRGNSTNSPIPSDIQKLIEEFVALELDRRSSLKGEAVEGGDSKDIKGP